MRYRRVAAASVVAIVCLVSVLRPAAAVEPGAPERLLGRLDAVNYALNQMLMAKFRPKSKAEQHQRGALAEFYAEHPGTLLWVDENGLMPRALAVRKVIMQAADYGLRAADYSLPDPNAARPDDGYAPHWLARAELLTSLAALAYAHDAQAGRIRPLSVSKFLDLRPQAPDPLAVVAGLADPNKDIAGFLTSFHPQQPQFTALRHLLAKLRETSSTGRIEIPSGPAIKPGETDPQIALLRRRLDVPAPADADAEAGEAANIYDPELVRAVKAFQRANGLHADGIVGPATRRVLNRPAKDKIALVLANMERWRWEPRQFGTDPRYIQINIPEYLVRLIGHGKPILTERIVAGKPQNQTPIFSDQMETVVFNPYWNVPLSIAEKEILPAVRRNPEFLTRYRLEVVWRGRHDVDPYDVDWDEVDARKVLLRQPPGRGNALGEIKFLFPNSHSVYLHDTPAKHLFSQTVRAFSHGCMRIQNPRKFAEAVLGSQGWNAGRIARVIDAGENYAVPLKHKIPVYITYFTVIFTEDGRPIYLNDIYGHERQLIAAMKRS